VRITILLLASATGALFSTAMWSAPTARDVYRAPSGQRIYDGAVIGDIADAQAPEGSLTTVRIDAERTLHVSYDGGYSFVLASGAKRPLVRLTSIPPVGPDGGLEPSLAVKWFEIDSGEGLVAVVFEYAYGSGGQKVADARQFIGVCVLVEDRPAGACQPYFVASSDVSSYADEFTGRKWLYPAIDSASAPARYGDVCPLVLDHDGDGFADLVLWKRNWRSAAVRDVDAEDESSHGFVVESQELLVMRFDPAERRFVAPRLVSEFEPPPPELCLQEGS